MPTLLEAEALVRRTDQWPVPDGLAGALLSRILERHRAVLQRNPDLVLPCVMRLGGWEDALQPTIEAWRDQWREQGRGAWLRSLRPPVLGLDAPILGEYPAEPAKGHPWFSTDDRLVGLHAPGFVVAWDRTSGAIVPGVRPPPFPEPRYSVDHKRTGFGRLELLDARSGTTQALTPSPDDQLRHLAELPEGDVLAGGWFEDYDGVVIRFDAGTGAIRWRTELGSAVGHIEISADGSMILVQAGTHYLVDAENGQVIAHLPNERGPAALSPSARAMAALDGSVLRVWDITDPRSQERLPGKDSAGLVDARFSARGSLLLRDRTLYNGRSGDVIAALPLESSDYLEGGPAPGCTEVLENGVIEAQVFRGLSRWNARGEHLWSKADRRYGLHHDCTLAFAPDGERYAVLDHESASIELCRVDDGTVLHELRPPTARWGDRIAFSLDGSRLAWSSPELDMVWDLSSAECLGQRAAVEREAGRPSPHGYLGFRDREHELSGRLHAGVFEVVGPGGTDVLARTPCEEPLVASPDGTRWASRRNHFALEGYR